MDLEPRRFTIVFALKIKVKSPGESGILKKGCAAGYNISLHRIENADSFRQVWEFILKSVRRLSSL